MFADFVAVSQRLAHTISTREIPRLAAPGWSTRISDDVGPVDQQPDEIRGRACELLDVPCTPFNPTPPKPRQPPNIDLSFVRVLVGLLLIGLLAWIVAVIVRYLTKIRSKGAADDEAIEDPAPITERIIDRSRSPKDWRIAAGEHLAAGRHREALRCRYRALVGDLARRGLLDEIPGRTTGEERRQLADLAPGSSAAFTRASSMFDDVWYGAAEVDLADHDRFVAEEDLVLAAAPKHAAVGPS